MAQTPPHKRNVNTVFQNYALFPHLTVEENVAFGLRYQKASKAGDEGAGRRGPRAGAAHRVREAPALASSPAASSSASRWRARSILNPAVLLLDEPLGALDAKLRKRLQIELKALQEEVGITFIYVTHDQEEALTMSDRIAVMSQGRVEQVGAPQEIYEEPATAYVADFLGVSNLMDADGEGRAHGGCRRAARRLRADGRRGRGGHLGHVKITIRPERVVLRGREPDGPEPVPGMVERTVYVGSVMQILVNLAHGERIQAWMPNDGKGALFASGTAVAVQLPRDALRVLPDAGTPILARRRARRSRGRRDSASRPPRCRC